MNQPVLALSVPLTSKQQDLVLEAEPMVKKMLGKLERMFPRASPEDMRQTVWLNVSEVASRKALSRDTFEAVVWQRVFGEVVDTFTHEARQNKKAFAARRFSRQGVDARLCRAGKAG